MPKPPSNRPHTTVVFAISADGKIADVRRSAPEFGSAEDKAHLERQVAVADGILFGATTLRAGGTAMRVVDPDLIQQRQQQGKPEQPAQIVCTRSGDLDPQLPFFQQAVPHWLITTASGAQPWRNQAKFDRIFVCETPDHSINWLQALQELADRGIENLAVLGGGEIVASLLADDLIDELYLTVCPLLLGGTTSPTPVSGPGWLQQEAPQLELLEVKPVAQEVFLHYRLQH